MSDSSAPADVYSSAAKLYAEVLSDFSYEADLERELLSDFLSRVSTVSLDGTLLDVGCGAGRAVPLVEGAGLVYEGCDPAQGMVSQAQKLYPGRNFMVAALPDLAYAEGQFDGVLAWYSLIHCNPDELTSALKEIKRVVKPGGSVLLAFQVGAGQRMIENAYQTGKSMVAWFHHPQDVVTQLRKLGFTYATGYLREPRKGESYPQGFVLAS